MDYCGSSHARNLVRDTSREFEKTLDNIRGLPEFAVYFAGPRFAAAAKTVGGVSEKLLQTLLPHNERQLALRFEEHFNIADGVRSGYYVVFGSSDTSTPLPVAPMCEVRDQMVFVDGEPARDLSWVLLELVGVPARTRIFSEGAVWEDKLRSAESRAVNISKDPLARKPDKNQAFGFCQTLIHEAQTLLLNDPNYLKSEADSIIDEVYDLCLIKVFQPAQTRSGSTSTDEGEVYALRSLRASFGLPVGEQVEQAKARYEVEVLQSLSLLRETGLNG